jgi:uncharacterized membrane protein YraQ (UPF0718 family)
MASGSTRIFALLATAVRVAFSVIAALIVAFAVFVLFEANPENVLVEFTADVRRTFGWFTQDLFTMEDPKIAEVVNAGIAALIWAVAGNLISKLIVRLTPTAKTKA